MFLKKSTNSKTGRTYLSIVNTYHDSKKKQSRTSTIKSLGYLDDLQKKYDDPIAYFTEEVRKMNEEEEQKKKTVTIRIPMNEKLDLNSDSRRNFGYVVLSKIYHELGIDRFLKNRQRYSKEEYDANAIMKLLVYSRLLYPASKKKTYEERHGLIGKLVEPYPKPIRKKEERHYLNDIASLLLVMNVQLVRQYGQWLHRYHS